MSKKSNKSTQTPKRSRSSKKRSASGSGAVAKPVTQESRPEKKHVSPLVTAAILIPVAGLFLYLASTLLTEFNSAPSTDPGEATAQTDPDKTNVVATDQGEDPAVDAVWETSQSRNETWSEVDDAASDGWSTEHFTNQAVRQFDLVKKLLKHPEDIGPAAVRKFASEKVVVGNLRPANLNVVFQDEVATVKRAGENGLPGQNRPEDPAGHEAFATALSDFASHYADHDNLRIKIKVFRVENDGDAIRSQQTVEVFGKSDSGLIEENLTWVATWEEAKDEKKPKLASLVVGEYERVERKGETIFTDVTGSAIGHSDRFRQQMLRGFNHWLKAAQFQEYYMLPSNPGVAIGDVNNDGLEDLFICQEIGLPCMLYLQQPDGTVRDFSQESNLDLLQNCRTALIVDWNNDGNNDIALAITGGLVIASGDGTGKFEIENVIDCAEDVLVLSAADYDLDGRLDLFAGVYWADLADWQTNEVPGAGVGGAINATDGGQNILFRNEVRDGTWHFADVTQASGMDKDNFRYTQAASWEDIDNDGDPDLYIANDFGFNTLFRNDLRSDGTRFFTDITDQTGVQDQAAGMSAAWGDYDRDGWMDLYVSNMYSYAGNRIAFQNEFKSHKSDDVKNSYQRFARGNTFFRNPGNLTTDPAPFQDLSLEAGVNRARWAWGSRFMDLNNDGWEDLVVANGFITTDGTGDL